MRVWPLVLVGIVLLAIGAALAWLLGPEPRERVARAGGSAAVTAGEREARLLAVDGAANGEALERTQVAPPAEAARAGAAAPAEEVARGAFVRGEVVDTEGGRVPGAEVWLDLDGELVGRAGLDAEGRFEFSGVAAGSYQLGVVAVSLGEEFMPAYRQHLLRRGDFPPGFFGTGVEVAGPGDEHWVRLTVVRRAHVDGYVFGPRGEPVVEAYVRISSSRAGRQSVISDAVTDERGHFSMSDVYPGAYRTQVLVGRGSPWEDESLPEPQELLVPVGGRVTLAAIYLGGGGCEVSGDVVDESGAPFAGLPVLCYLNTPVAEGELPHSWPSALAATTTDADGRFVLAGVPCTQVMVQIAPMGYLPNNTDNVLARFDMPVALDLSSGGRARHLPTRTLTRSNPFVLKGQVLLASGSTQRLRRLFVRIHGPEDPDFRPVHARVSKTGEFEWRSEFPPSQLSVEVYARSTDTSGPAQLVFPERGRVEPVELWFP